MGITLQWIGPFYALFMNSVQELFMHDSWMVHDLFTTTTTTKNNNNFNMN